MEIDGLSRLDAVKDDCRVPAEVHLLVDGAIDDLRYSAVQVRPQEDPVAVRDEILRQTHDRRWFCGGGCDGWWACEIKRIFLKFVHSDQGDNASNGKGGHDDKDDGHSLAYGDLFGHGGRFVR